MYLKYTSKSNDYCALQTNYLDNMLLCHVRKPGSNPAPTVLKEASVLRPLLFSEFYFPELSSEMPTTQLLSNEIMYTWSIFKYVIFALL